MKQKSIFSSLTFWGMVLSYLNAVVPLLKIGSIQGFDLDFYMSIAEATIVFGMTVVGRYSADSIVYTPKVLPGRNRRILAISGKK